MSESITGVLHELVDVASGRQAHLSAARADELHETLTPGWTAVAPSDDEIAKARAVLQAAIDADAAKNPPAPAEAPPADEPAVA